MFVRILITALAICSLTWSNEANAIYIVRVCTYSPQTICGPSGCRVDAGEVCRYENWEYGGGGGSGGGGGGSGGGGSYTTCTLVRGDRPMNCSDQDPGNPADFPDASAAIDQFSFSINVTSTMSSSAAGISQMYGCVGGGHGSVQNCAAEIFLQIGPTCTSPNCRDLMEDLMLVMGTDFIDSLEPDSFNFSFAYPTQIGISPDFDDFPEWVKTLITRAEAQMDCHSWHLQMDVAGCTP